MPYHVDYDKAQIKTCLQLKLLEPCAHCLDSQKAIPTARAVCKLRLNARHKFISFCVAADNKKLGLCKCSFDGIDTEFAKNPAVPDMIECTNKKCELSVTPEKRWYHTVCVNLETLPEEPETWLCPGCASPMTPKPRKRGRPPKDTEKFKKTPAPKKPTAAPTKRNLGT